MKDIFIKNNIPTTKYIVIEESQNYYNHDLLYPLIVKPADSNSSKGIEKIENVNKLIPAINIAKQYSRSKKVVIEEYFSGDELSIDVILKEYEPTIIMITKNIKMKSNDNRFTIVQNVYPFLINEKQLLMISMTIKKIALSFDLRNGPLLVQMLVNGDRINIIEFSSRIGGGSKCHLIKAVTNIDIVDYFINIVLGYNEDIKYENKNIYASMNYIYTKEGIYSEIIGGTELYEKGIIDKLYIYKPSGSYIENNISSSDRPAGFLISAKTKYDMCNKIQIADRTIKILNECNEDIMLHKIYSE
jgi:biotin carboxylase